MATFQSLRLQPELLETIDSLGFKNPTAVQEKVIPLVLKKEIDLVALAQTGTGKTAAFGFPLLQKLDLQKRETQSLIIAPTRELCLQITSEMERYSRSLIGIGVVAIYGGANINEQANKIKRGAHIVVATPGRLKDMIRRKMVSIEQISHCVLDEADEMLNMGFYEDIKDILTHTPKDKKIWLFSATMPNEVHRIAKKFMETPIEIEVGARNTGTKMVEHHYYLINVRQRYQTLQILLNLYPNIFGCIFCRTKIETQKVAERLQEDGYKAAALHGDLSQNQRDAVMQSFRKNKIQLLVATDVAARGIDVEDISHVINYQLPDEIEVYTHRSGRTGRAGKKGVSIILLPKSNLRKIKLIENKMQVRIKQMDIPNKQSLVKLQLDHWVRSLKQTPVNSDMHEHFENLKNSFEDYSKEDLLALMLSKDLKPIKYEQLKTHEDHSLSRGTKRNKKKQSDRFFINIGARDEYEWTSLKDFLKAMLKVSRDDIFQVEVMKNFSFFSMNHGYRDLVLNTFSNFHVDDRRVSVELTKKEKLYSSASKKKKKRSNYKK
tara:strand:+ start:6255 stop:7901 length:1647 start_codon:yes stop_codon:yes gene_type:complete